MAASASLVTCAMAVQACGSRGDEQLKVGSDDDGGGPAFPANGGSGGDGLDAHIQENGIDVTFVTVSCSQGCADVVAVATGGDPPYSFTWENGSTDPSRHVCPTADAVYTVTVRDTAGTGELSHPASTAKTRLAADVIACPDGGAAGGACLPGSYGGTFVATGNGGINGDASSATGPVTLALAVGDAGPGELVPTGSIDFNWALVGLISGPLSGQLDCATGNFMAEDPTASWTAAGLSTGVCDLTVTGHLDTATSTIAGQFSAQCTTGSSAQPGVPADSVGTWTATRTP